MIRVSTTHLETFRRIEETEWGDESELIAQIMGKPFTPSWQMLAGSQWDAALSGEPAANRYTFATEDILKARAHIGPGLWQVKDAKLATVCGQPVTVVAQVDHILGLTIQENKAKFSPADPKDYEPSLQWRFYLWVHGAAKCRYNLFSFADPDDDGLCRLREITSFSFFPYDALESECMEWLTRFVDWAWTRRLLPHLERESSTPEYV